jgi:hypothetical protein
VRACGVDTFDKVCMSIRGKERQIDTDATGNDNTPALKNVDINVDLIQKMKKISPAL